MWRQTVWTEGHVAEPSRHNLSLSPRHGRRCLCKQLGRIHLDELALVGVEGPGLVRRTRVARVEDLVGEVVDGNVQLGRVRTGDMATARCRFA